MRYFPYQAFDVSITAPLYHHALMRITGLASKNYPVNDEDADTLAAAIYRVRRFAIDTRRILGELYVPARYEQPSELVWSEYPPATFETTAEALRIVWEAAASSPDRISNKRLGRARTQRIFAHEIACFDLVKTLMRIHGDVVADHDLQWPSLAGIARQMQDGTSTFYDDFTDEEPLNFAP